MLIQKSGSGYLYHFLNKGKGLTQKSLPDRKAGDNPREGGKIKPLEYYHYYSADWLDEFGHETVWAISPAERERQSELCEACTLLTEEDEEW